MYDSKKICLFVDGENLRHSIVKLFSNFDGKDYLPKSAKWKDFFDWIAETALERPNEKIERVRTYWYVVQNIDFSPFNLNSVKDDFGILEKIFSRNKKFKEEFSKYLNDEEKKKSYISKTCNLLLKNQEIMRKRFDGWIYIQNEITKKHTATEFRRAGSIRYDLFEKRLGSEKAVDVKLATDLIKLKDIYDVAIIVSGDQDYVPAVDTIKDFGKRVINVAFKKEDGKLLPGGAKRLAQTTDSSMELTYSDFKKYLNL